jgi:flavin-binding protein dodecin
MDNKEANMYGKDRIYKKVEIIGVSGKSIEAAIETALIKARNSLDKLSWFEVQDIRGHIGDDGKVAEYQVVVKVSFQLKD